MEYESAIRLISFVLILIVVAIWEIMTPCRTLTTSKKLRWFNNLSIVIDGCGICDILQRISKEG